MADLPTLTTRPSARVLGLAFIGAGLLHFLRPRAYEAIMPPWLPAHRELVLISGAAEIAGGVAALFPAGHRFCRWWLIALLLAVFPANVHMALHPDEFPEIPGGAASLWVRLPFQAAFIAWVLRGMQK